MPLDSVPDSLVQKVRNELKPEVKFLIARKTLAIKILDSDPRLAKLKDYATGNFAILLSNKDPTELNRIIVANKKKLGAKPNQVSPIRHKHRERRDINSARTGSNRHEDCRNRRKDREGKGSHIKVKGSGKEGREDKHRNIKGPQDA